MSPETFESGGRATLWRSTLPDGGEPSNGTSSRDVLVVEDEQKYTRLFETWLHKCFGDEVTVHAEHELASARETLQSLSTLDFALLDRKLPDGTGDELLAPIEREFDAITMMITAVTPESDVIRRPIDDYLVKPADEETFVKRLFLLEKLDASQALKEYSDARKASLLEYHLDDPTEDPLFRRFTSKWDYDRLEVACYQGHELVYELYTGDADAAVTDAESAVHVSITGELSHDVRSLLDEGLVESAGEIIVDGDDPAWVSHESDGLIEPSENTVCIYQFTCDVPEQYVADFDAATSSISPVQLSETLERGFS